MGVPCKLIIKKPRVLSRSANPSEVGLGSEAARISEHIVDVQKNRNSDSEGVTYHDLPSPRVVSPGAGRTRHAKLESCGDIEMTPSSISEITHVDASASQNGAAVLRWLDETHAESLLNPKQSKEYTRMLMNLRHACCFGSLYNFTVDKGDLVHTFETLYKKAKTQSTAGALGNILTVDRCVKLVDTKTSESLPVTKGTPSLYLKKLDIPVIHEPLVSVLSDEQHQELAEFLDGKRCPLDGCTPPYALDKDGVPEELIELQPSMSVFGWQNHWEFTKSYVIERLANIGWSYYYTVGGKKKKRREKVIIFSQFTDHLMLLSLKLKNSAMYKNSYAELYPNSRDISALRISDKHFDQQLRKFKHDDKCFILLMGHSRGAVRLDLSVAHHIFLMDPIWDGSLQKQVVARAQRMRCKETVLVKTLVMKNSIKYEMMKMDEEGKRNGNSENNKSGVGKIKSEYELANRRKLLIGLNTVVAGTYDNGNNLDNNNINVQNQDKEMDVVMEYTTPAPSSSSQSSLGTAEEEDEMKKMPLLLAFTNRKLRRKSRSLSQNVPTIPCNSPVSHSSSQEDEGMVGNSGNDFAKEGSIPKVEYMEIDGEG